MNRDNVITKEVKRRQDNNGDFAKGWKAFFQGKSPSSLENQEQLAGYKAALQRGREILYQS